MSAADRVRTVRAEGCSRLATDVTEVSWTLPLPFGNLFEFEAFQVIRLGTALSIAHNQVSPFSATEAMIFAVYHGWLLFAPLPFLLSIWLSIGSGLFI